MYGDDDILGTIPLAEANPEYLIARVAMVGQGAERKVHFYSAEFDRWTTVDLESSAYNFDICTNVALARSGSSPTLGYSALTDSWDSADPGGGVSTWTAGNTALLRGKDYYGYAAGADDWSPTPRDPVETSRAIHHNVALATGGAIERLLGFSAYTGKWTSVRAGRVSAGASAAGANVGMLSLLVRPCVWGFSAVKGTWTPQEIPELTPDDPLRADTNVGLVVSMLEGRMYGFSAHSGRWTPSESRLDPDGVTVEFLAQGNLAMVHESTTVHIYSAISETWTTLAIRSGADRPALGVNADGSVYPAAGT